MYRTTKRYAVCHRRRKRWLGHLGDMNGNAPHKPDQTSRPECQDLKVYAYGEDDERTSREAGCRA